MHPCGGSGLSQFKLTLKALRISGNLPGKNSLHWLKPNLSFRSECIGPVSYTHLDVYKRQVYGLGADAANPEAVAKVFAAKGRPADHPLIVHLPGAAYLDRWASGIPDVAWELVEAFWPGPLTLILKRTLEVPYAVTGGQETILSLIHI